MSFFEKAQRADGCLAQFSSLLLCPSSSLFTLDRCEASSAAAPLPSPQLCLSFQPLRLSLEKSARQGTGERERLKLIVCFWRTMAASTQNFDTRERRTGRARDRSADSSCCQRRLRSSVRQRGRPATVRAPHPRLIADQRRLGIGCKSRSGADEIVHSEDGAFVMLCEA